MNSLNLSTVAKICPNRRIIYTCSGNWYACNIKNNGYGMNADKCVVKETCRDEL